MVFCWASKSSQLHQQDNAERGRSQWGFRGCDKLGHLFKLHFANAVFDVAFIHAKPWISLSGFFLAERGVEHSFQHLPSINYWSRLKVKLTVLPVSKKNWKSSVDILISPFVTLPPCDEESSLTSSTWTVELFSWKMSEKYGLLLPTIVVRNPRFMQTTPEIIILPESKICVIF